MKVCRFCAEEIQDAAIVCKHCGRDLGAESAQQVSKVARGPSDKAGIALLVLLAIFLSTYAIRAVSEADADSRIERGVAAAPSASPVTVQITPTAEIQVPPDGYQSFEWDVPAGKSLCRLTGRLEVVAGGNKDIQVYLVSKDDWINLRNGHGFRTYLETPRTSVLTFDETLRVTGRLVLVVSNKFSVMTPKYVQFTDVRASCN